MFYMFMSLDDEVQNPRSLSGGCCDVPTRCDVRSKIVKYVLKAPEIPVKDVRNGRQSVVEDGR